MTHQLIGTVNTDLYLNSSNNVFSYYGHQNYTTIIPQGTMLYVLRVNVGQREHLVEWLDSTLLIPSEFITLD